MEALLSMFYEISLWMWQAPLTVLVLLAACLFCFVGPLTMKTAEPTSWTVKSACVAAAALALFTLGLSLCVMSGYVNAFKTRVATLSETNPHPELIAMNKAFEARDTAYLMKNIPRWEDPVEFERLLPLMALAESLPSEHPSRADIKNTIQYGLVPKEDYKALVSRVLSNANLNASQMALAYAAAN